MRTTSPRPLAAVLGRFFRSARLGNDPGSRRIRAIELDSHVNLKREAEAAVTQRLIVPRRGKSGL